jgi:crotonobetainyl-CoA:carnitine CoA-transferase CaiB-like acyl-CoA transferase
VGVVPCHPAAGPFHCTVTDWGAMSLLDAAWSALGENPDHLAAVQRRGREVPLDAALPVGEFVHDAIAAASLSVALDRSSGAPLTPIALDPARVATAVTSERWFRRDGEEWMPWAALSGLWPTADGWVRTHANYGHHRARLLAALDLDGDAGADALAAALAARAGDEVEAAVAALGGIATVVRTPKQWREHPHAAIVAAQPVIGLERLADADARARPSSRPRILDLTRVIAGPVATRTLALGGADVLRVDPPGLPEPAEQHLDTGAGKRSVILAVDDPRFEELLAQADVLVTGYRPGALDARGLSPDALAQRYPGLVVARLSAWGATGPWGGRRGFDSIVQAATGISAIEGDNTRPGALPAQGLDHSAGYLLAAGIGSALRRRAEEGGSWRVEVSLVRLAHELLAQARAPGRERSFDPTTVRLGPLELARPALAGYDTWPHGPVPFGSSTPTWAPASR